MYMDYLNTTRDIYVDRNDYDNLPEVNITYSGVCNLNQIWNCDDRYDPCSRLYFVFDGEATLTHNGNKIIMTPGNVYFIPAETSFACNCVKLQKLFFHISVTKPDNYDIFANVDEISSMPYPVEKIMQLVELYKSNDYISLFSLKTEIINIVLGFAKNIIPETITVSKFSKITEDTITYIKENTNINLTAKKIADALFVSESTLRQTFKKEVGISLGKYIDDVVMFKAQSLLKLSDASITEISNSLGFCDQFYFSKRFKEKFNQTPSKFKKYKI